MMVDTTVIERREGKMGHGKTNTNKNKINIFTAHAGGKTQAQRGEQKRERRMTLTNRWKEVE